MEGTTQGDLIVIAIYAIAIIPVVLMLVAEGNQVDNTTKTAAYADDLTATGTIISLRNCWETLCDWDLNSVTFLNEANRG